MSVSRDAWEGEGRGARGRDLDAADPIDDLMGHPTADDAEMALEAAYLDDIDAADDYALYLEEETMRLAAEADESNDCSSCAGSGGSDDRPCGRCRGTGRKGGR
jgi:hypothetical protein